MSLQPTFKPRPKNTYFIFNTKTGLYSRGGMIIKWGKSPKTWTKGGVKLHLVQHRDFYRGYVTLRYNNDVRERLMAQSDINKTYNFDTDFIYDMETNAKATDVTLAGFLIKSSYDDKIRDYNYKMMALAKHQTYATMYADQLKTNPGNDQLKTNLEYNERNVRSYRVYLQEIEHDLTIIKEFATNYNVAL